MSKNTTEETTQSPAEEMKVVTINWKKVGKYAAIAAALVGAGIVVGHNLSSSEEETEVSEETEDLTPTE